MELSVMERLIILGILPQEGNLTTIRIVNELSQELSFSEEEHKVLQFRNDATTTRWNPEADVPKEVAFGAVAQKLVREGLGKLDEMGRLTIRHLSLCEKFGYTGEPESDDL